jgi:hypothetical protein
VSLPCGQEALRVREVVVEVKVPKDQGGEVVVREHVIGPDRSLVPGSSGVGIVESKQSMRVIKEALRGVKVHSHEVTPIKKQRKNRSNT